jgi:uncharacterized protein
MPEYLAPGVYVEEVSFRSKLIEGVSTSTTGFVGPTRFGPISGVPELVTSLAEFQRKFGLLEQLIFDGEPSHNYLAHGVRAFFENGGQRLYISRTYRAKAGAATPPGVDVGCAYYTLGGGSLPSSLLIQARFPGFEGNLQVGISFKVGENVLLRNVNRGELRGVRSWDVVWVQDVGTANTDALKNPGQLYAATRKFDDAMGQWSWLLHAENDTSQIDFTRELSGSNEVGTEIRVVTAAVEVIVADREGKTVRRELWDTLAFHPKAKSAITQVFARTFDSPSQAVEVPLIIESDSADGPTIARVLLEAATAPGDPDLSQFTVGAPARPLMVHLAHGSDGERPEAEDYEGSDIEPTAKTGLIALEDITDISIVAAPGYSASSDDVQVQATANLLISHAERMRYRIAVLDPRESQTLTAVRQFRAKFDSKYAALYYPWVRILDPITEVEIHLPPSGFVTGIYARNDIERGVHKAPANEVVRLATGFEFLINKAQQDVLNPEHINVLRYLPGRGYRVWGARTATSDPEWKYVNLRRYFAFLEASIDRGTQWAVFEPNGDELWSNVRRTVDDFLFNEWRSGHLLGVAPVDAYFVRCDRTTMTQNDLDNGRLVCLIGVAPLRPAEFVIFRIGQWTADRRS